MKDIDFSVCPFIRNELCFLTYNDFVRNARILKLFYDAMEDDAKIFYKWYVYANIHMDESFKNLVWNYLNSNEEEDYNNLIDNVKKYKVK